MRAIKKKNSDRHLENRHKKPPTTAQKATRAWNGFRYTGQSAKACYKEQYGLCGYSEISIDNLYPIIDMHSTEISRTLGSHLEHVEPKSKNPQRTFDHSNLILSAIDDVKAQQLLKPDVFGGHHKQKMYSASSFISPLNNNCEDYFHYETSGKIVPKATLPSRREKAKARLTIYILNLNAPILVNWRKNWLSSLDSIIESLDGNALYNFAELELSPIKDTLRPFHTAQKQLFGVLGKTICQINNI
jgi:uncharacterized protein (TIGR02646 family)